MSNTFCLGAVFWITHSDRLAAHWGCRPADLTVTFCQDAVAFSAPGSPQGLLLSLFSLDAASSECLRQMCLPQHLFCQDAVSSPGHLGTFSQGVVFWKAILAEGHLLLSKEKNSVNEPPLSSLRKLKWEFVEFYSTGS